MERMKALCFGRAFFFEQLILLKLYNSLGKYQIQSRQKEQFYTKDKTALNVILSNCTRPRTVSW